MQQELIRVFMFNDLISSLLDVFFIKIFNIPLIVYFFFFFGIFYTLVYRAKYLKDSFKFFKYLKDLNDENISGFGLLVSCVGTVVGIGNILGGAISVQKCGAGVLFWVWVVCLVCVSLKFRESYFSVLYAQKHKLKGCNVAFFYIKDRFKHSKYIAFFYIFCFSFAYFVNGLVQATQSIHAFEISNQDVSMAVSFGFVVLVYLILNQGLSLIVKIMKFFVPFAFVMYCGVAIISISNSSKTIEFIFSQIISEAFNPKSVSVGLVIGYVIQRLCFAVDLGTGLSGTILSSSNKDPYKQAVVEIFEVVFVCVVFTLTGLLVLSSESDLSMYSGINIVKMSISNQWLRYMAGISIFIFGFTTIFSCGYLSQSGLKSINFNKMKLFNFFYALMLGASYFIGLSGVLNLLDLMLILTSVINIVFLFLYRI